MPEEADGNDGSNDVNDADAAAAKKLEEQMAALQQDLEAEAWKWGEFHPN